MPSILGFPAGLAHNGNGDLYLTDLFPGMVHLIDVFGAPISDFSYLPHTGSASGITTDGTHIYLADSNQADVDIYTLAGVYISSFSVASETTFPEDITYNPFTGNLYIVEADLSDGDEVLEYTTTGLLVNTFPLTTISTDGIAFDPVRCTYWVYDSNSDLVTHYDPTFNIIETFLGIQNGGFLAGEGVAVIGDILYVAAFGSNRIVSFDLTGADNSFADTCNVSTAIDLTIQKNNDINGLGMVGVPFNWLINVANMGLTEAIFEPGELLLQDVLPDSPTYGSPMVSNISGIAGSNFIFCNIENHILTCTANGGSVTLESNGGFNVMFSVTPTVSGTLDNPAQGGICRVDPNNVESETNESNNNCTDSIIVQEQQPTTIDLTAQKSNDVDGLGEMGTPFNWAIKLTNAGPTAVIFEPGEVLLQDILPDSPTYGPPTAGNFVDIAGSNFISCGMENHVLTCLASDGPVAIGSSGSLDVVFSVTPTVLGTLNNPAQGGICRVDPNNIESETNESNNNCADSILIMEEQPTAIDLASFEVQASDGQAIIVWQTATEIDNAGFNIYRALSSDGPWLRVNSALIAAEGDPVSGADYTFIDTPGRGTFYYRLEDIDFFGLSTQHPPALVEMGAAIRIPWYRPSVAKF